MSIERAAAIVYEYKHGEPPPTDSPRGPIGPAWDCWKAAEAILALADDAEAVEDRAAIERAAVLAAADWLERGAPTAAKWLRDDYFGRQQP